MAARNFQFSTVVLWAFGCVAMEAGLGAIAAPFVRQLVRGGTGAR